MVFAQAGVGKSMWATSISLAIGGGGSYLGWKAYEGRPRKVLIVDGEMDMFDLHERSKLLVAAMTTPTEGGKSSELNKQALRKNVTILARQDQQPGANFPDIATVEGREQIIKVVERHNPSLVVLDNFSTLASVDDENAANSFDPVIVLMQECQIRGAAVMLVHHSKKNGNGSQAFRGTSKMEATFTQTVELKHPGGMASMEGTAFDMRFHKQRRRRDASTSPQRVRLVDGAGWVAEANGDGRLEELVEAVRSLDYPTQGALATAMGVSPGQLTKLKKKAIAAGLIDEGKWTDCMKKALEIEQEPECADEPTEW